jgi:hypothetical protein
MAYCTITDVQGLNPQRSTYSATTKPSLTQVTGFINQIYGELNAILLSRGLTVPVTAPADFLTNLQLANAEGAAALAEMAMFPEAIGTPGGSPHGQQLWKMYTEFKDWLKNGSLPAGVSLSGGSASPRSFFERNEATETEPEADYDWQKPKIQKNKEF